MQRLAMRLLHETDGQDLIEYALLASTIALGVIAGMQAVQGAINTHFENVSTTLGS
jgi:Flp pilus assembly pilin Flp